MTRRAVLFRHISDDTGGRYPGMLRLAGFEVQFVDWHRGETFAASGTSDLMVVLGGAQQVWEVDANPWLAEEKDVIRDWVAQRAKPFIGICFGHQLLADALGGKVEKSTVPEIGVTTATFAEELHAGPVTTGFHGELPVTQWHTAEVTRPPDVAAVHAYSAACPVQAMSIGTHAFSTQFHHEWDMPTVECWSEKWRTQMDKESGDGTYDRFTSQMRAVLPGLDGLGTGLFQNFSKVNRL